MTYFVKVTRLNSTDYEIKKNVNAEMTHHIKDVVNCQNSRDKGPPEGNSVRG